MLNLRQTWWIGVTALFLTQYACASSAEATRRLIKSSFWAPPDEENANNSPTWADFRSNDAILSLPEELPESAAINENAVVPENIAPPPVGFSKRMVGDGNNEDIAKSQLISSLRALLYRMKSTRRRLPVSSGEADKRQGPSGFLGSRGKRFIPGLESLLLAKYYQDAEKWKRQPSLGFQGSRG